MQYFSLREAIKIVDQHDEVWDALLPQLILKNDDLLEESSDVLFDKEEWNAVVFLQLW